MRMILVPVASALAAAVVFLSPTPAPAAGCLKGAVVGGVAGTMLAITDCSGLVQAA